MSPFCVWCYFCESSFRRRDAASVSRPHDENGVPTGSYWLAWPPFLDRDTVRQVMKRRFSTSEAAMKFADATWPFALESDKG